MTPTGSAKLWIVGGMAILAAACHRPLDSTRQPTLQETVENAIARELAVIETTAPAIQIEESQTPPDDVLARLAPRRAELEAIGPLGEGSQAKVDLGPDLTGERQGPIEIGLTNAVQSAVNQNLAIQASRLQPQITARHSIALKIIDLRRAFASSFRRARNCSFRPT